MLYNVNFFRFSQILLNLACTSVAHHETKWDFCSCSIDRLFDNLESGKRKYCFGKSWILDPKIFTNHYT